MPVQIDDFIGQPRRAFARDDDLLEAGAGVDAGAGAVVDAGGEVGLDLLAVVGIDDLQAGAAGLVGAFEAVFADLLGDVHVGLFADEAVVFLLGDFLAAFAAVEGDAALLVGDDDLHAVLEDDAFQHGLVFVAVGGVHADDAGPRHVFRACGLDPPKRTDHIGDEALDDASRCCGREPCRP